MQTCNFYALGKNPQGDTVVQFTPLGKPMTDCGPNFPGTGFGYISPRGLFGVTCQFGPEIEMHSIADIHAARAAAMVD